MKARVATVLSLTGVLVAGSAAALVNTQVLRNSAPVSNTVAGLVQDSSSTTSGTAAEPTEPSATTIEVAVPSTAESELSAFQVGSSGLVTLDKAGDVLRIDSSKAAAGWTVVGLQQVDTLNVKVLFQQGDNVVEFRANLLFDEITPSVSAYLASQGPDTSTSVATGGTTNTSTAGTTRTTVDHNSNAPTTSDDSGKGRGGHGGDDDPSDDD